MYFKDRLDWLVDLLNDPGWEVTSVEVLLPDSALIVRNEPDGAVGKMWFSFPADESSVPWLKEVNRED